jgi:class 3 adenylate cyclase
VPDLPSGTVTFLFTDIEGSTRLLKQLRDRYAELLADHQRLLREAFDAHDGREVDTQGDSFFAVFARARDAVLAAADAQRAFAEHEWPDGAAPQVRMGLHTGEPLVGEDRYVGLGVHRAARVMAAGHGGQVLLSEATAAVLADEELPGLVVQPLGEHRLKDLDRPERIYQLEIDGLPTEFPRLKTLEAQPDEATPFAGREDELAEAAQEAVAPRRRPAFLERRAGSYVVTVLRSLGYKANLKLVADPERYFAAINDSRRSILAGGSGWIADYVSESFFIRPNLTCDAFIPDSAENFNYARFCDPRIDAQVERTAELQAVDPHAAGELWARIDREIVDRAPWVPLYNNRTIDFVSERVGNYQDHPQWGVLLDQLWVR